MWHVLVRDFDIHVYINHLYDKLPNTTPYSKDADKLAHVVYEPGSKALEEISKEFGKDILDDADNTQIDRKKLGAIVFSDAASMSVSDLDFMHCVRYAFMFYVIVICTWYHLIE